MIGERSLRRLVSGAGPRVGDPLFEKREQRIALRVVQVLDGTAGEQLEYGPRRPGVLVGLPGQADGAAAARGAAPQRLLRARKSMLDDP